MADELSLIVGEIRGAQKAIEARVDRSDEQTDAKTKELAGQIKDLADTHLRDKAEAIQAREEKEKREESRFKGIDTKLTDTFGMASFAKGWIDEKGEALLTWWREEGLRLAGRISTLEQAEVARATERAKLDVVKAGEDGEKRGESNTWKWIWGAIIAIASAVGSVLAALTGLSPETIDRIKAFFHG